MAEMNNEDWISVSELAERIGKTKQTVYNKIRAGLYETKTFSRGKMRGILVRVPKVPTDENA